MRQRQATFRAYSITRNNTKSLLMKEAERKQRNCMVMKVNRHQHQLEVGQERGTNQKSLSKKYEIKTV